jgi:hypothetical protein
MRDHERPPADPRLLAVLDKADLNELVTRLLGLARRKMWRRWQGVPPSGETHPSGAERRPQVPEGNVDLCVFFVMVVRSLIGQLAEKVENRCVHTPIEEGANLLMDWKQRPREAEIARGLADDGLHPPADAGTLPNMPALSASPSLRFTT